MVSSQNPLSDRPAQPNPEILQSRLMHDSAVAEAKFRGLLEVAPDAMVTVDDAGTIVLVNGQVETLFGYDRDELLGKSVDLLLPERFQGGHEAHRSGYT